MFLGLGWSSIKLQIPDLVSLGGVSVYGMKCGEDAIEVNEPGHEYVGPDWIGDLRAVWLADKGLLCGSDIARVDALAAESFLELWTQLGDRETRLSIGDEGESQFVERLL